MAEAKQLPPPADEEDELQGSEAPLLDHLIELRKRLIRSVIVLFVLLIACFFVAEQIFDILVQPYRSVVPIDQLDNFRLIYTAPQEYFFTQLSLAFFGALFIGFPYLAYEIYSFVAPGLYKKERRAFVPYLIATPLFFLLGTAMVYFVVLPLAMGFFQSMQTEHPFGLPEIVRIQINGHTDNVGAAKKNKVLSEKRAQACRDYLISKGIDASRIEAVGHGDEQPLASNDTEAGRQENRRIEAREL